MNEQIRNKDIITDNRMVKTQWKKFSDASKDFRLINFLILLPFILFIEIDTQNDIIWF